MKKIENVEEANRIISICASCADYVDMADALSEYDAVWDSDAESLLSEAYRIVEESNPVTLGLCRGRHDLPVDKYIFEEIVDVNDFDKMYLQAVKAIPANCTRIDLYMTGLTAAAMAVVRACNHFGIALVCYNYDRDTGKYIPQRVLG